MYSNVTYHVYKFRCGYANQMAIGPGPDHRNYLANDGCGVCVWAHIEQNLQEP